MRVHFSFFFLLFLDSGRVRYTELIKLNIQAVLVKYSFLYVISTEGLERRRRKKRRKRKEKERATAPCIWQNGKRGALHAEMGRSVTSVYEEREEERGGKHCACT